jgi:hypothetical protein
MKREERTMGVIILWVAKALLLPVLKADDAHARWRDKELKEARQLSFPKLTSFAFCFPIYRTYNAYNVCS